MIVFLGEAVVIAALGGVAGLVLGAAIAHLIGALVPMLPVSTGWFYVCWLKPSRQALASTPKPLATALRWRWSSAIQSPAAL